jgi:O-acetyl-ADP-ribose deacetylase (regulator of RNase III)
MAIGIGLHCWYCEHGPCNGECKIDPCQESPITNVLEEAKLKARYSEVTGDLIALAKEGAFNVIVHGCNCHSTMAAGIAPHMAQAFGCDKFNLELKGPSINKLGCIDYETFVISKGGLWNRKLDSNINNDPELTVVNAYTQYRYGKNHIDGVSKPVDYEAITIVMRKLNVEFKGLHIGLPKIGAGLAGGDWERIKKIIQTELIDCKVTIVILPQ